MSQPQQVMQPSAARAAFPPHQAPSPSTQPAYPPMPSIAMPPNQFQNGRSKISPGPSSPQIAPNSASPAVTPGIGSPNIGIPTPGVQHQHVNNYQSHQSQPNAYQHPQFQQQTVRLGTSTAPVSQPIGSVATTQAMSPSVHPHPPQYHQASPHPQSPHPQSPSLNQQAHHNYATFQPLPSGTMGPPTNPSGQDVSRQTTPAMAALPKKTFAYDMDDTLAGTGINLEEEEQYMNDFETRNGFGAFAPGGRGSFYGAGPANQKPDNSNAKTQEELAAEAADWAWNQAARRLAISRTQEMKDQFLAISNIYVRMDSIAKSYGLELNEELKPDPQPQTQYLRATPMNPKATVNVQFQKAADGTMVRTSGCFLPKTAYLADQLALMSLATKERLGEMLSDANKVATSRQQTAHGAVPPEWMDAATLEPPAIKDARALGEPDILDSAVSPRTNPLKRPAKEISNGLPTPVSEASPTNPLVDTIVSAGKQVRDAEEARLRKRQKRLEEATETEKKDDGTSASRSGSIAPGTPGSVAPESESKTMSKKESKKMSKLAEMTSNTVNSTVNQFMGSKKKKKYSWMTGGAGGVGSGATTPRMPGSAGTPSGGSNRTRGPLTNPGAHHLGQFREDSEKGKNIQLRDWIYAMEQRAIDKRTLQEAYNRLDRSDTGDKVATPSATAVNGAGKA